MNEYIEKNYREDLTLEEGLKIVCQSLANNFDNPKKNSDITVVSVEGTRNLTEAEIEHLFIDIEAK